MNSSIPSPKNSTDYKFLSYDILLIFLKISALFLFIFIYMFLLLIFNIFSKILELWILDSL